MKRVSALVLGGAAVAEAKANPIRRIVTLMQDMSKEISAEVAKEKELFKKFECYCKKNSGDLAKKTEEAAALIKKATAEYEQYKGQKKQLTEEIKQHKKDRASAEKDLKAATEKRAEEKAKFDEDTKDQRKTIDDLNKAISALEKGMGKAFLQTKSSVALRRSLSALTMSNSDIVQGLDMDQQSSLESFLQNKADYSSQSGEIVGILKVMLDNVDADLGGVMGAEEAAVKAFATMKSSLQELIKTSGSSIEKKQELAGSAAVKAVEAKNLVSTTEKQMGDDAKTAAELKEACSNKGGEFKTRQADAAAEVDAINQAIGVLNGDDAVDLFRKTDTKGDAFTQLSLLQIRSPVKSATKELTKLIQSGSNKAVAMLAFSARQALKSKTGKVDFGKVIKMVDDMAALLKQEGADDLKSRDGCNADLNSSEAELKEVGHAVRSLNAEIEEAASVIDAQITAVKRADDEISGAKEAMAQASKQRKEENAEFIEAVELNKQAVELIFKAKDKLNAYYNPDLVREVPVEEQAAEELLQEAPATWEAGARKNKGQKGGSVLALMDTLANDLNKDTAAMEHGEQTAQRDYEKLSQDLAEQVASSSKARNEALKTKADTEAEKQTLESTLSMKTDEQTDINNSIQDLHAKCDFILANFEERKAARENEIDGLGKAKAVLSGAKFD